MRKEVYDGAGTGDTNPENRQGESSTSIVWKNARPCWSAAGIWSKHTEWEIEETEQISMSVIAHLSEYPHRILQKTWIYYIFFYLSYFLEKNFCSIDLYISRLPFFLWRFYPKCAITLKFSGYYKYHQKIKIWQLWLRVFDSSFKYYLWSHSIKLGTACFINGRRAGSQIL